MDVAVAVAVAVALAVCVRVSVGLGLGLWLCLWLWPCGCDCGYWFCAPKCTDLLYQLYVGCLAYVGASQDFVGTNPNRIQRVSAYYGWALWHGLLAQK